MLRRTMSIVSSGPPALGLMPSFTGVPSLPLMRAMLASMAASAVGCPSTVTMMSPGLSPAFAAGDPSNTFVITRPCLPFSRAAPMPEYLPAQLLLEGLGLFRREVHGVGVVERLEACRRPRPWLSLSTSTGLVVAALQLLDDALLQVAGLLGGVGLLRG